MKEGWSQKRVQVEYKVDTNVTEQVVNNETKRIVGIVEVADKLLERIEGVLEEIVTTQDIRHLTSALKDLREIKGIKSDIDRREQEARIAKLQKEAEAEEVDKEIRVTIDGDLDLYSK